jgi:hypothetical protein
LYTKHTCKGQVSKRMYVLTPKNNFFKATKHELFELSIYKITNINIYFKNITLNFWFCFYKTHFTKSKKFLFNVKYFLECLLQCHQLRRCFNNIIVHFTSVQSKNVKTGTLLYTNILCELQSLVSTQNISM